MIKFVSDLRHVGGFSPGIPLSSTKKADRHDIAEILSKVALSNINQTKPFAQYLFDLGTQNLHVMINSDTKLTSDEQNIKFREQILMFCSSCFYCSVMLFMFYL